MLFRNLLALSLFAVGGAAAAQDVDESALEELDRNAPKPAPVANEPLAASQLRDAMRRIASNTQDASALTDAGYASLSLGDANAALNFLTRANALRPRDARITAGLGSATVRTENPFEALRLFDDAVRLGASERSIAFDRGLAFDLLGNFSRAQQDYQLARSNGVTDDLIIRQAISLSLSGQYHDADLMLDPLLKRNVAEAWRTRTFLVAARGDYRESSKLAQDFVDPSTLPKMQYYLGLMPKLTGAQQAAALHLGHFPANHQIGHDSEEIRRIAATFPVQGPQSAKGESRLIPTGKPLGAPVEVKKTKEQLKKEKQLAELQQKEREKKEKADKAAAKKQAEQEKKLASNARRKDEAPPAAKLSTESARAKVKDAEAKPVRVAQGTQLPPPSNTRPLERPVVTTTQLPEVVRPAVEQPAQPLVTSPSSSQTGTSALASATELPPVPAPQPGFDTFGQNPAQVPSVREEGVRVAQGDIPDASVIDTASQPETLTEKFDLGAIVSSIEVPASEAKSSVEAVDLASLKQPAPKVAAPAIKPANTTAARYWVQIATGKESILDDEFRRLSRQQPELFSAKQGWSSSWSATSSRLLVGPFDTLKDAKQWESDFRGGGGDGFAWRNADGVEVLPLGVAAPVKAASKPPAKQPEKTTAKQGTTKSASKQGISGSKQSGAKQATGKAAAKEDSKPSSKGSTKQASQSKSRQPDAKSNSKQASTKQNSKSTTPSKSKQADSKTSTKQGSNKTSAKQANAGTGKQSSSKTSKKEDSKPAAKTTSKRSGTQQKSK